MPKSERAKLGLVIHSNLTTIFNILKKIISKNSENNTDYAIDYILNSNPTEIFNSKNELADPYSVNPKLKKYLIVSFQEFVRAKEVEKQNEEHSLPVTTATTFVTNTDYNSTNTSQIGLVGVNVGRNSFAKAVPLFEIATSLQEQIDNIGNFEPDFYQNKIAARDLAYLENKRLTEKRLEEEQKLAKEEARQE